MIVPLHINNGLPIIRVDGYNAIVDTGSPKTVGNDIEFTIHNNHHHAHPHAVFDIREAKKVIKDIKIDLLLGMDVLSHYQFQIDTQNNCFMFNEPLNGYTDTIHLINSEWPLIAPFIIDGVTRNLIIDTGAHIPYLFDIGKHTIIGEGRDWNPTLGDMHFPMTQVPIQIAHNKKSVTWGILSEGIKDMFQEQCDVDGFIGYDLYKNGKIAFNLSENKLLIGL